jgi:peptidoglycan/LPS O-acetylase OafA/YrhL
MPERYNLRRTYIMAQRKNGKIELMRFVFSVVVILFHCYRLLGGKEIVGNRLICFPFMPRGYIAVEFFFLVSGYLMAKKLANETRAALPVGSDMGKGYIQFLWGKVSAIFPYHIVAFVLLWVVHSYYTWAGIGKAFSRLLNYIPGFFLVQKTGLNFGNLNSVEWYISAMLILGWLIHDYGTLSGASNWDIFGFRCFCCSFPSC